VACTGSPTSPVPALSPYPAGTLAASPATESYPVTTPGNTLSAKGKVPFHLNKPVLEGATQVVGTGPVGVPISLQDVTFMGTLLSETVIGADGKFVFQVAALEKNHRIGIALGDLTGTSWKPEDFYDPAYQGEGVMLVPQVDLFYDTVMVQGN